MIHAPSHRWDEWVPHERILKINEDNLLLQKQNNSAMMKSKKTETGKKASSIADTSHGAVDSKSRKRMRETSQQDKDKVRK